MTRYALSGLAALLVLFSANALCQGSVPTEVQMPGTQPMEIGNLESPDKCDNCHGGYNSATEPAHNWRGSMMSHAGRDPIFWATMAIAEQDFAGSGDLCLRCHSTAGWLAGRSTPTDGSGLAAGDGDGVECDYCHKLTNPDDSEHLGEQFPPFIANDGGDPAAGYYGSGMSSLWAGSDKLGPYNDADARHQFMRSAFHRDRNFCGTCHDVSNPVTGDLAPGNGTQPGAVGVVSSSDFNGGAPKLGGPVQEKAAFNNLPHAYGIVERTFSEYLSGGISQIRVDDYPSQGEDFPFGGALEAVWKAATKDGTVSANYQNPSQDRYFSCQTCHMRPVTGQGANKRGVPVRDDLPLHDMTGGNYWMPYAIDYLDGLGKLRLGGGLSELQRAAMFDGSARAIEQLQLAASLGVENSGGLLEVKVVNHTGHKLISGYPEGRRMWLNVRWFDANGVLLREDGRYGDRTVTFNGAPLTVRTLLNPGSTTVFEAHMGLTREWAARLVALGYPENLVLMYDPDTGAAEYTLGELANAAPGASHDSFHFALNNTVISDNRIPPWQMSYDMAKTRNALPVPATQYGDPGAGGAYKHYADVYFTPPEGAESASVSLMYQPTSWEYVQFLALANDGSNAFLAEEGSNLMEAWLNTGMAEPVVMAESAWGNPGGGCDVPVPTISAAVSGDKQVTVEWSALGGVVDGYTLYYDQAGKSQKVADSSCISGACSLLDTGLTNGVTYDYKLTAHEGECESGFSAIVSATPQAPGQQMTAGVVSLESGRWIREGKGKNATTTWETTSSFVQGDTVIIRGRIGSDGSYLEGAAFAVEITGPESLALSSGSSGSGGWAEASWSTQRPNRKGQGGTATGNYTAAVVGVTASGYNWDGVRMSIPITIQ